MRNQIIMIDNVTHQKTVLRRDVKHYFKNLFEFLSLGIKLFIRYNALCTVYNEGQKKQRTCSFWKKQFNTYKQEETI